MHNRLEGRSGDCLEVGPVLPSWLLIPEGEYRVVSREAKVLNVFKERRLELVCEVQGGPFDGTLLPWYCRLPPRGGRPPRSSHFNRALLMVNGRPLGRGERPSLESLVGKMF